MKVFFDNDYYRLTPAALIGQGGEAEVYALNDGRVLKYYKQPEHHDFHGDVAAQMAATLRLTQLQQKLRCFPTGLPACAVVPTALVTERRGSQRILGYVMPRVGGEHLMKWGDPRWRSNEQRDAASAVRVLLSIHAGMRDLHAAGVVIGDVSDLNILVDNELPRFIDVDSWQFGAYLSALWTTRFVDPSLCDNVGGAMQMVRPHNPLSDWFGYAVLAFRTLLGVAPYGGVHSPADPGRRVTPSLRPLERISVFNSEVVCPRATTPWQALSDSLIDYFRQLFAGTSSGAMSARLLEELRFTRCASCNLEHARRACPRCVVAVTSAVVAPPVVVSGSGLRVTVINVSQVPRTTWRLGATVAVGAPPVLLRGDTLVRVTKLGEEVIGSVVGGETCAFLAASLLVGFYRVGGLTVAFTAHPDKGGISDEMRLPSIRGQIVNAYAAMAGPRAWLTIQVAQREGFRTVVAVIESGRILAIEEVVAGADEADGWMAGYPGACAVGASLFVPTDSGITRLDVRAGVIVVTRVFPNTNEVCAAGDELQLAPNGFFVRRGEAAFQLQLS